VLICSLLNIFCLVNSFQKFVLLLLEFQVPEAQEAEGLGPKPSLNVCADFIQICEQRFGFPLALYLHIPTDKETYICMPIFIDI